MSVIINNTIYFIGPLYTSNIYSTNNISIINNTKFVSIITTNTSCTNAIADSLFIQDISSNNATISLGAPINYTTNFNNLTTVTYMGLGITTTNNISNTLGYIYSIKNENVLDVNASFPMLSGNTNPIAYWTTYVISTTTSNLFASINIREPGMYLLYVYIPFWVYVNDTNAVVNNYETEITVNNTIITKTTEMNNILLYRKTVPQPNEAGNSGYAYNKTFMCNITSANSKLSMSLRLTTANIIYIQYTYNSNEFYFKYYAIKIS
jgi:hypothetical protein